MQLNKDKWFAALKKAKADTKMPGSSGLVCALATVRLIRDEMIDSTGWKLGEEESPEMVFVKEELNELIKMLVKNDTKLYGFACNASAASKAAGIDSGVDVAELVIEE